MAPARLDGVRGSTVDARLARSLVERGTPSAPLADAMRDAVFPGGKRWRPALALGAAQLCGAKWERAVGSATAVELLHSASLCFDDLPCMDDAPVRRGSPALHVRHGSAMAMLAGLGLLTAAFELLSREGGQPGRAVRLAARHVGAAGMLGGQALDLALPRGAAASEAQVRSLYRKTSALVVLALQLGALHGTPTPRQWRVLSHFGRDLGEAFQAADDLRDGDGPYGAAASLATSLEASIVRFEAGFQPSPARDGLAGLARAVAGASRPPLAGPLRHVSV